MKFLKHLFALALIFAPLLTACSDTTTRNSGEPFVPSEDIGVFYRIQASYELIETGEPLDFDFIISCYNKEVPGSFNGALRPRNMFMATSTGAAVGISPPKHYCERALRGMPLEQERDLIKMPMLMWYDDVNNFSLMYLYMTNDAYTGPNAKVRFKSYSFEKSNRDEFLTWEAQTRAEYTQIGAIPGPFGCNSVDSGSTFSCGRDDFVANNSGQWLAVEEQDLYNRHSYRFSWPVEVKTLVRTYLDVDHRYYCPRLINSETGKRYERRMWFGAKMPGEDYPPPPVELKPVRYLFEDAIGQRQEVYLDPEFLLSGEDERPIIEVYPKVIHKHGLTRTQFYSDRDLKGDGGGIVLQIVERPEWRGFGILHYQDEISALSSDFRSITYSHPKHSALFINETLICENRGYGLTVEVYDLERGQLIRAKW